MNSIAVEDMITVACETFVEYLSDTNVVVVTDSLSGSEVTLYDWYMNNKSDAERRIISEKLLENIESFTK